MPNALTHKYISDIIFDALDGKTKAVIAKHKKAYTLGSLGPDIIMGLLFEKEPLIKNAGDRLHEDQVFAALCNTANYLRAHPEDEELYAYYMGFLTHYAADSTIHPYVYYYIENRLKRKYDPTLSSVLHTIVETEMDVYVGHVFLKGRHADTFYQFCGNRRMRRVVKRYFLDVNEKVFGLVLDAQDIRKSFFFFRLLMWFTQRHKNGSLRFWMVEKIDKRFKADHLLMAALRPRRLDARYDYLNFDKVPYRAIHQEPFSEEVDYTFPEMVEIARLRGVECIRKAAAHIAGGEPIDLRDFELNYNGAFNAEYLQAVEEGIIDPREQTSLLPDGFERFEAERPGVSTEANADETLAADDREESEPAKETE